MVKFTKAFSRIHIHTKKIMVIGDFLVDTYTIGKARRISPEAPVAVVLVQNEERRPGGAGNVVLNLISLGSEVVAVGRIGSDLAGELLAKALQDEGVDTRGLFIQQHFQTPVKNRIIAENQQIVRVDYERVVAISESLEQIVIDALPGLLTDVNVIAISDYGKGFLSPRLLEALIRLAKQREIPVIVDPKGIDFVKYQGATIIKPNLSEAYAAANLPLEAPLEQVAARVLQISQADLLIITRSEAGISVFYKDGRQEDFAVHIREVKDVTGAGDTVLAMLACSLANELPIPDAVQLCNIAAGIAIERLGCARVTLSEISRRFLESDMQNKIFDQEHLFALQEVLRGRKFVLLSIVEAKSLTSKIFNAIRYFSKRDGWDLLIYIQDPHPEMEFIEIMTSINEVDFIILNEENLRFLQGSIEPTEIYVLEGDEYRQALSIESLLEKDVALN